MGPTRGMSKQALQKVLRAAIVPAILLSLMSSLIAQAQQEEEQVYLPDLGIIIESGPEDSAATSTGSFPGEEDVDTGFNENAESIDPSGYILYTAYPNPFNRQTIIRYFIPVRSHVKLSILSVLGRKVEILLDKVVVPGVHQIQWNAQNVSSGLYLYRFEAESQDHSRRYVSSGKILFIQPE